MSSSSSVAQRAASPLLETKFYVPKPRPSLVARPRLSERLSRGAKSKLTLISAPAGFGKTTLLAEWLAAAPDHRPFTAWLSLDQSDDQPASFWPHLIASLQTVAPGIGAHALSLLQEPQPPPNETVLTTLLNELNAVPNDVLLVLDDYHLIDVPDIQAGMSFVVEHLPPHVHVVIATRADPVLPMARLRGRGELTEIRAADLRFTPNEAAAYLNEVMGLDLAARDVAALEGRTEGWIAALQLAALSMQGRDDIVGFIDGFAGDDRYIVDYLVEEVLQRQPEQVRSFLLATSILTRLSGPLCDSMTGKHDGRATLEALERGNLFLVPLDDRRQWYRYHQLFADVLQAHLLDEQSDRVPDLHRRASDWYEQNGERSEAIRHALAAEDFERAANLVELALPTLRQGREDATLRLWLQALPDEVIRVRPVLSVGYAGALMVRGEVDGVEARLRDAERWLDTTAEGRDGPKAPSTAMVVVDEEGFRRLPPAIAMYRAGQALILGDVAGTMTHARRALELVGEDDHVGRGGPAALLGLAYWSSGDLDAGHRWYAEGMASLEKAGHFSDAIGCAIALADIRIAQSRLHEAMSTYQRGLQLATERGAPVLRGAADMHVGMSQLLRERNDLDAARQHLQSSTELGEHLGLEQNPYRWRIAMARLREAEGNLGAALDQLDEADRLYVSDYFPNVRPIAALKARLWIRQGRLGEALGWARERGLSAQDELTYLREFEHITLARLLLAQSMRDRADGSVQEAIGLLERLMEAAEAGGRVGSLIETLVVLALAHHARGNLRAALSPLERALTLAEPEGYVRIFVDEGPSMAAVLEAAARDGIAPNDVRHLLAAFGQVEDGRRVKQALVEPLSERELDVLRLLGTDLTGPDIAGELTVSLNTVRTHTKNIYAKLGVNNRRAAVRRGEELGLLSRARSSRPRPIVLHDA
jgi:LuxR family maltose regulon positive regulatory protein